ncbi:Uncharacterised protein [Mycobacteroides abscessus subsp. abscessus]|nr:Uncharacterised protein [Mycobacteroides abscessus subsp. abscessus]
MSFDAASRAAGEPVQISASVAPTGIHAQTPGYSDTPLIHQPQLTISPSAPTPTTSRSQPGIARRLRWTCVSLWGIATANSPPASGSHSLATVS